MIVADEAGEPRGEVERGTVESLGGTAVGVMEDG